MGYYGRDQGIILGYARIQDTGRHSEDFVGAAGQRVRAGEHLLLEGPLRPLRVRLTGRGFTGIRYTPRELHAMMHAEAQAALDEALRQWRRGGEQRRTGRPGATLGRARGLGVMQTAGRRLPRRRSA